MLNKIFNWIKKFYKDGNCGGDCCQGRKACDCTENSLYDDQHLDGRNH